MLPACDSSSPTFCMMYLAYKLNKQDDNRKPWCTPFPTLNQPIVPCPVLIVVYWPAYRFLKRQVRCSVFSIFFRIFQFVVIHTVKGFSVVSETEVDVFLEFPCFFLWFSGCWHLISGSSAFSKSSLYLWKFSVHVLLKPRLKDFEHNLTSMWNECNHTVVLTFLVIVLLWD